MLRFPVRPLSDLDFLPTRVLTYIAQQVGVPPDKFFHYGTRQTTRSEHLTRIRTAFGYRDYDWRAIRLLMHHLVTLA